MKNNEYGQRWSIMRVFNIPSPTHPGITYLKRLRIVQTPMFGFYIHWINLPDEDRDPHDHPWKFISIVLRGGYKESVYTTRKQIYYNEHKRFSVHKMGTEKAHQITKLQPRTVTLIFTGKRSREWGFWTEQGWVPWREYNKGKGYGPDPFMS